MNTHNLIEDIIEERIGDGSQKLDEKAKAQREIDLQFWTNNSVTREKLADLNRVIEETEDVMYSKALTPIVEDREVRVMAIRVATLNYIKYKLVNV